MGLVCWKKGLIIFAVYYVLLFAGAAIIMYIEAEGLKRRESEDNGEVTESLQQLLHNQFGIQANKSSLNRIMLAANRIYKKVEAKNNRKWKTNISWLTLVKWRYFTQITLSTVGYGDIVPETDGGKIFVIFYAFIGIPINLLITTIIGFLLCRCFIKLIKTVERRLFHCATVKHVEQKTCILLLFMCVSWLTIGAAMTRKVMKWTWLEGFYAAFVKFSTIGYGDYTLDLNKTPSYVELLSWYTNIGLALIAGLLDAINKVIGPGNATSTSCKSSSVDTANTVELTDRNNVA